ncbi:GNAT family N-acetyltransferase, partial [Streptomyces sp. UNOC14_S4]|nr:GNAT family N-acetyltransferase [Streptomyces sp. UNOC14_S4]
MILSFPEEAVPGDLRAQVLELQEEAWPASASASAPASASGGAVSGGPVHDPLLRPLSMLLVDGGGVDGGVVLAALDVLSKEIVHAGGRYAVGGLST